MTIIDWSGVAIYITAIVISIWLAVDLYAAWQAKGKSAMARNLFIMSLCWVAWSVFAMLTIILVGDLFWRDVTRTALRVCGLAAIVAMRWAIKAR